VSRREAAWSALGIFVAAVAARIVVASLIAFPTPEDTAYYVGVARNLVEGRGLVADAIWSFQTPPLQFPRPAFEVWLPLPSFLAAIPMALFGTTFRAAQVMSVLVGAIVPVLAWRLGADVAAERGLPTGRARTLALGSGLTAAVSLPLLLHSALPDSTMPFAVLALAACLLMPRLLSRIERNPGPDARQDSDARRPTAGLVGLGVLIGLAALTRNEAIWLGLAWLICVWLVPGLAARYRVELVAVPAVVALLIFAPWAIRDWREFGNPLPGQALVNALSVTGSDVFAWKDQPTVARYLALGPARLFELRVEGIAHNLFSVLVLPGIPTGAIGLFAIPALARLRTAGPTLLLSAVTFFATSLLFPVSTTWGTFLHAAGPAHVLLIVGALLALDWLLARVGRIRGWTKPVAWLGAGLTLSGCLLFSAAILPSYARSAETVRDRYVALDQQLSSSGIAIADAGPVISDFPIWLADTLDVHAVALPAEPPASVLDLARTFGSSLLVTSGGQDSLWPAILDAGGLGAECFEEVPLAPPADPVLASAVRGTRAFRLVCP
jgi:hypothetical protein